MVVGKLSDFENDGMRTVELGDSKDKILICRSGGEFSALSPYCTHYGAPLEEGALGEGRIVCPLHHSCFSAKNGDLLEPPAFDSLAAYGLEAEGENLVVTIPDKIEKRRMPGLTKPDYKSDKRRFAIIGGGAAGYSAAQTLRENGFKGRIYIITRESRFPYDRPNLSKEYLQGKAEADWMPLRGEKFYDEHGIDIVRGREVLKLDVKIKEMTLDDGQDLVFDKILIATGGKPFNLDIPGADLGNIFTLRSFGDADEIIAAAEKASRAAVIGSSFIGMETAYSLSERGIDVTVIGKDSLPFETTLGKEIGELFMREHENLGIAFEMSASVSRFAGDGKVEKIIFDDGKEIPADLVLVGIGVTPATGFIEGIGLNPDGSLKTDIYLAVADDVYAAGDVASFPDPVTGERRRIEHWRTAEQQGKIAALNMLGKNVPYSSVPFFWTAQAGLELRYVGHARTWDYTITWGSVADKDFITFYISGDRVAAAAGNNRDAEMAAAEELMRTGRMPAPNILKERQTDLVDLLN
jgi:NADPH-dependent 2,4-dienoyl-CoA reductase/sulfur reductase-like enzyme/nitrite reductase/ring-hydroxylating ferredoxin subunit